MLMLSLCAMFCFSVLIDFLTFRFYSHATLRSLFAITAIIIGMLLCCLVIYIDWPFGIVFSFVYTYRFINSARLLYGRMPLQQIRSIVVRTVALLTAMQTAVLFMMILYEYDYFYISSNTVLMSVAIAGAMSSFCVIIATLANIAGSRPKTTATLSENEYPTVSVAIAARNETPQLFDCLQAVVASDYPKLEVLVFDDNSQDTTAEIIKSFAHDGVRFIPWEYGNGDWLAKNKAYQILLEHASGEIIAYIGVDVRLEPDSIRKSVEQLFVRNVRMISIVPQRAKSGLVAVFIQPIRYWWELAIPKFVRRRPPVLSTAWLIYTSDLRRMGSFHSYKKSIIPEEHFTRRMARTAQYAFVRATQQLNFKTQKTFASQWDTQVRTRYPHAHRRPETAMLQTVVLSVLVLWPFAALPLLPFLNAGAAINGMVIFAVVCYAVSHIIISIITNPIAGIFAPINFPLAVALDILALHVSMYKYEFSKVIWKGRDVAPKKLQVISKLPQVDTIQG